MVFITVKSDEGPCEKLLELTTEVQTVGDFQLELQSACGIPVKGQLLSLQLPGDEARSLEPTEKLLDLTLEQSVHIILTSFASLISQIEVLSIEATELRGIQRQQLHQLWQFLEKRSDAQGEMHLPWRDRLRGTSLRLCDLNLYHLADHVIRPATRAERCSYVELIADGLEQQMPKWFVSHAWQEAICDFITCLDGHSAIHQLGTDVAYWVCAYANNQHELGQELRFNPRETSFFRAMHRCEGVLLILDSLATPFSRIWCCFELAMAMISHFGTAETTPATETTTLQRLLLEIVTVKDGKAEVLTDGLTHSEEHQELAVCAGRGGREKAKREETFPIELIQKALALDIAAATSSRRLDKIRILNSIAGVPEELLDTELPDPLPPERQQRYAAVDRALRCTFALASVSQVISKDLMDMMPEICSALAEDTTRRRVRLSFANCMKLTDEAVCLLAQALPSGLTELLRMDLRSCHRLSNASLLELAKTVRRTKHLRALFLDFYMCNCVTDTGVIEIWKSIEELKLQDLDVNVRGLVKVSDKSIPVIISALDHQTALRKLHLNLTQTQQTDVAAAKLTKALGQLKHLEILKLYFAQCVHVGDATAIALGEQLPMCQKLSQSIICFEKTRLTDEGMRSLTKGIAFLHQMVHLTLRFRQCQELTQASLQMLGDACRPLPLLEKLQLDLSKCHRLKRDAQNYSGNAKTVLEQPIFHRNDVEKCDDLSPNADSISSNVSAKESILSLFRNGEVCTEKLFLVLQKLEPELSKESFDQLLSASPGGCQESEGFLRWLLEEKR